MNRRLENPPVPIAFKDCAEFPTDPSGSRNVISALLIIGLICCAGCSPSPPGARAPSQADQAANVSTGSVDMAAAIESNESDDAHDEGPVRLAIVSPKLDGDVITLTLQVTNRGTEPIVWDREFSIFLTWKVHVDDVNLNDELVAEANLDRDSLQDRFVTIGPGEFMKKDIEITKSMRTFWHARGSIATPDGGSHSVPVANEQLSRYVIPQKTRMIRISAHFDGDDGDALDGFAVCFRKRPEATGIVQGRSTSNEVSIRLK